MWKKSFFIGCSKRSSRPPSEALVRSVKPTDYKAPEIQRNESYIKYDGMTMDEGNAVDGPFSTAC
jgi:hypothetical protein